MTSEVKYPDIDVQLVGQDGNAFMILGRVSAAIRRKHGAEAASAYSNEAMEGDYDNLLRVTATYVNIY